MIPNMPFSFKNDKIYLDIYVQPKSSVNKIIGIFDNFLKIKIKAPPVDGAANKECIKFMAKILKIPKKSISIISGETGRRKKIEIEKPNNQTVEDLRKKILRSY